MVDMEEISRLRCEHAVNETWAIVGEYYDHLVKILDKGSTDNETEDALLRMAANAVVQKMTLERSQDKNYLPEE